MSFDFGVYSRIWETSHRSWFCLRAMTACSLCSVQSVGGGAEWVRMLAVGAGGSIPLREITFSFSAVNIFFALRLGNFFAALLMHRKFALHS